MDFIKCNYPARVECDARAHQFTMSIGPILLLSKRYHARCQNHRIDPGVWRFADEGVRLISENEYIIGMTLEE